MKTPAKIIIASILLILLASLASLSYVVYRQRFLLTELDSRLEYLERGLSISKTISESFSGNPEISPKPASANAEISALQEQITALKTYVDEKVSQVPTSTVTAQPAALPQTAYISMGTTHTSTNTAWVDVPDSDVYIDLVNDYGSTAYVTWSASLKVAHGNGTAYARLYDATNNIAVIGSELASVNNSQYQQVASGALALWRGKNLYRVQLKSLNSFEVTLSNAKIKISY